VSHNKVGDLFRALGQGEEARQFPNQGSSDSRCWLEWRPASDGATLFP
jgi:hypothetical protein